MSFRVFDEAYIALGIVCSGFLTSSDIEASIPVGLRQYAP